MFIIRCPLQLRQFVMISLMLRVFCQQLAVDILRHIRPAEIYRARSQVSLYFVDIGLQRSAC
jgi:hypothetical protein